MTYVRELIAHRPLTAEGAGVGHLAELATGELPEGPLIRPFAPPSTQGEKGRRGPRQSPTATAEHEPHQSEAIHFRRRTGAAPGGTDDC
jgi:hypothetical protein